MNALKALLSNRSEVTAVVGVLVALGAKAGLQLDDNLVLAILGIVGFVLGVQGATNHGATAAAIAAQVPVAAPVASTVTNTVEVKS